MPDRLWNVEWPNVNTQRKYPLMEGQDIKSGDFVLPNDFLVDLVLSVNAGQLPTIDPTKFHLAQVGVYSAGVTVSFGYDNVIFTTISIPISGFEDYNTYSLVGVTPLFDTKGWLTIGQLDGILKFPGVWNFTVDNAKVVPSTVRPNLRGVTSIRVANGSDYSSPLVGDVTLVAGSNFRFRMDLDNNRIIFDCINGDGLQEECDCTNLDEEAPPIRTINGIAPNSAGDFLLRGTSCVLLTAGTNGITIEDSCSEPCCDCRELQVITGQLEALMSDVTNLEMLAERLDGVINNAQGNILVSKTTGIPR